MKSADRLARVGGGLQIETLRDPFLRHAGLFGDGPRDGTATPVSPAILSQLLCGESEMLRSLGEDFLRPAQSVIFGRSLGAAPVVPDLALAHLPDPGHKPLPECLRAPEPAPLELFR